MVSNAADESSILRLRTDGWSMILTEQFSREKVRSLTVGLSEHWEGRNWRAVTYKGSSSKDFCWWWIEAGMETREGLCFLDE